MVINEIYLFRMRQVAIRENRVKVEAIIRRRRDMPAEKVRWRHCARENVRQESLRFPLLRPEADRNRDRKLPMPALIAESRQWGMKYPITRVGTDWTKASADFLKLIVRKRTL
jgi:hypothetical protein